MEKLVNAIFLDTNVFEGSKFFYEDNKVEKLFDFSNKNKIPILINEVVLGEVKHRISENARKIVSGLTHEVFDVGNGKNVLTRKDNLMYLSRIFNIPSKTKDIEESIENKLLEDFNDIKNDYLDVIKTDVNAQEIISLYFDLKPPFEAGKKKEEFPDAIIGFDIKNYSKKHNLVILTVTNDKGLSSYLDSESLINVPYVNEALHILIEQSPQVDKERVNKIIINYEEKIKKFIEDNVDFYIYSYDYENTVDTDSYEITSLELNKINIIEIHNEEDDFYFEISCHCNINIKVTTDSYPDYETGMRDKETDTWYYHTSLQSTHKLNHSLDFEIMIHSIDEDSEEFEMEDEMGTVDIEYDLYDSDKIINIVHNDNFN